jgi:hypothetical protein
MDFLSMPRYPAAERPQAVDSAATTGLMRVARGDRVLLALALLTAMAAMLLGLRLWILSGEPLSEPPPRPQLDFSLVQARFEQLRLFASRAEVEDLLGPPSPDQTWEAEFAEWTELAEYRHRALPEGIRLWEKWTDPQDKNRWVAVLFAAGQVYAFHKKGF